MKRPSFQFYPADWRKDAALQSCSIAAQGLWINCLCIAHECEPYGFLVINGQPMTPAQIGRLVGIAGREAEKLLNELVDVRAAERRTDGCIWSRRMVRDEAIRTERAGFGHLGAAHGGKGAAFGKLGGRPKAGSTPGGKGPEKPPFQPAPSSSSSSSTSEQKTTEPPSEIVPPASAAPRGKRMCPESFLVDAKLAQWGKENHPAVDLRAETRKFRDHTFSRSIISWPGAWRNWIAEADRRLAAGSAGAASFRERDAAAAAAEVAKWTGGRMGKPTPQPTQPDFIDMEPTHGRLDHD